VVAELSPEVVVWAAESVLVAVAEPVLAAESVLVAEPVLVAERFGVLNLEHPKFLVFPNTGFFAS